MSWRCRKCSSKIIENNVRCDNCGCERGFWYWLLDFRNPIAWLISVSIGLVLGSVIGLFI